MQHSPGNGEVFMEGEMQQGEEQAASLQHNEVVVSMAEPPPTSQPPPPPTHQPPPYHPPPLALPYTLAPFGFTVQPLPTHFQLARHPHVAHQVYHLSAPTFQYPPHAANNQPAYVAQVCSLITGWNELAKITVLLLGASFFYLSYVINIY